MRRWHLAAEPLHHAVGHPDEAAGLVPVEARGADDLLDARAGSASARSSGVGYRANSAGVTMFTRTSVVCADRIVAVSSSKGLA